MASQEIEVVHKRVKQIIESLDGYKMTKNSVNKGQGQSGNADFTVLYRGITIDIECKWDMWIKFPTKLSTAKGRLPTALQSQQLQATDDAGGIALVVDRHTMEQLIDVFETIRMCPEDAVYICDIYDRLWHTQYTTKIKEVNL